MMTPSHAIRRSAAVTAAVLAAGLAVVLGPIPPAAAHGGEAEMEVVELTRDGDDVAATISLIFVADGHGVPDATVTVVVDDGTPTPMAAGAEEGQFTATVAAAPESTLRFTSVDPAASVTAEAPAAEEEPTTSEPTDTTAPTPDAPETEPPATTEASATTLPGATSVLVESEGDDGDSTVLTLAGITLGIGLVGAVCVVMLMRSRQSDALGRSDADGPSEV